MYINVYGKKEDPERRILILSIQGKQSLHICPKLI